MDLEFSEWYDKTYPSDDWDTEDLGITRFDHKRICYSGWLAAKRKYAPKKSILDVKP